MLIINIILNILILNNAPRENVSHLNDVDNKPFSNGANFSNMAKQCGIYKITSPTKRVYIGQSVNIKKRFLSYKHLPSVIKQSKVYKSLKKYGIDKHKFEVIHLCEPSELNEMESYYIKLFQATSDKHGLNIISTINQNTFGIKHGKDVIEYRKKKGMPKNALPAANKVLSVPIKQFSIDGEFIKEWESITAASNFYNRSHSSIRCVLIGRTNTCAGFVWKYVNPNRKFNKSKSTNLNFRKATWRPILEFDENGIQIKRWLTVLHAAKHHKMSRNTIKNIMNSDKEIKRFKWEDEKHLQLNKFIH